MACSCSNMGCIGNMGTDYYLIRGLSCTQNDTNTLKRCNLGIIPTMAAYLGIKFNYFTLRKGTIMSNAFTKFMQETYEHNELADIATHGCASGCAGGMIYYSETIALFDKYRDDLFEIMGDYQDMYGEPDALPHYVLNNAGTFAQFANNVVWFCAEAVAYNLTQGGASFELKE